MPETIVKAQGYIKRNISVLYLAEVKKQSRAFLGAKAELKLLACQRKDQSWSAVPGEEMKETEEAVNFENGALVLINLGDNRQIQGKVEPAASKLVSILQNFSRVVEKAKKEEDSIEQWKQSLTYQSQELIQRETEMEGRLEQLEQLQEEFDRLAQERQEFESSRAEAEAQKAEFERKQSELEGAWEHLRGEKQQLNEQQGTVLDEGVSRQIQQFLEQSAQRETPTEELRQQIHNSLDLVNRHQETLDFHWQQKEEKQAEAEQKQLEVNEQRERLNAIRQGLQEIQDSLSQAGEGFQEQQSNLQVKQGILSVLGLQLQHQDQLHDHLSRLAVASDHVKLSQEIDLEALENMPLGELESKVEQLQQDLDRVVSFVNDQEEELMLELQDIETVRSKIATASEYDKLALDQELNETQDRYQMLDRTLMGQRRNLREREEVYGQHSRILRRRKGLIEESSDAQKIDLTPVLKELDSQRQDTQEELQHLEKEIEQMGQSIQQAQEMIDSQTQHQGNKQEELHNLEASWQEMQQLTAEIWAKVNLYEEMLHPLQDNVNNLRQQLEGLATLAEDVNANSSEHLNAIAQMQETLKEIMA